MRKSVSEAVLRQEAAFWDTLKKAATDNPGTPCHK